MICARQFYTKPEDKDSQVIYPKITVKTVRY